MAQLQIAPAFSTPASHLFDHGEQHSDGCRPILPDDEFSIRYEIERTISEIRAARYVRIALQFPDEMLPDAARVHGMLVLGLKARDLGLGTSTQVNPLVNHHVPERASIDRLDVTTKLYILGDTSYGACCVDEVAAEHIEADAVVHYGRACLSPTSRIPVIHVFTIQPIENMLPIQENIIKTLPNKQDKLILMTDVSYQYHLPKLAAQLRYAGYSNVHEAKMVQDQASPLPNRTVPEEVEENPSKLKNWHLFHISDPPEALLLTLFTRVARIHIISSESLNGQQMPESLDASASRSLNRRYAILTSVSHVSIFGILINTLSVKNYLHMVDHVKRSIEAAGKKSYTFVVGKLNAAKVANFSEIGAWVVIGCWESSLIDSKDFWKPIVTPFELRLALQSDDQRAWTGAWIADYQSVLDDAQNGRSVQVIDEGFDHDDGVTNDRDYDSEPETAPPVFDLRTGKYVSHSKPLQKTGSKQMVSPIKSSALLKRSTGDLLSVGGAPSPGAEYLHSQRTWRGLGGDQEYLPDGIAVEEGASGLAKGYTHGAAPSRI